MPLLLLQLGAHPTEIAATKLESCIEDGAFFLDFSRPLGKLRWLGAWNTRLGFTMSLLVPIIHQAESTGRRSIAVDRGDPYFRELQRLWKERFPSERPPAVSAAPEPEIAGHFATQFPHDSAPRSEE
jgi:precorrin-6B methylase 1